MCCYEVRCRRCECLQTPDSALHEKWAWNVPYYIGADGLFVPLYANAYVQSPPTEEDVTDTSGAEKELVPVPREWLDSECLTEQLLGSKNGIDVGNERTPPPQVRTLLHVFFF